MHKKVEKSTPKFPLFCAKIGSKLHLFIYDSVSIVWVEGLIVIGVEFSDGIFWIISSKIGSFILQGDWNYWPGNYWPPVGTIGQALELLATKIWLIFSLELLAKKKLPRNFESRRFLDGKLYLRHLQLLAPCKFELIKGPYTALWHLNLWIATLSRS